jgi:hypothetical protein
MAGITPPTRAVFGQHKFNFNKISSSLGGIMPVFHAGEGRNSQGDVAMRTPILIVIGAILSLAAARAVQAAPVPGFTAPPHSALATPVQYPPYVCGYSYNPCGYPRPYRPHHFCRSLHYRCIHKAHRDIYFYPWSDFRSNYTGCMRYDGCNPRLPY